VVALRAWDLLSAPERQEARKAQQVESTGPSTDDIAFFPLTLPFTTGPGTISVAVALGAGRPESGVLPFFLGMTAACVAMAAVIWLAYRSADRIASLLGASARRTVARLSAFILLCIGVQIMITGVTDVAATIIGR
jgi:multiple antibiotic resistance protein